MNQNDLAEARFRNANIIANQHARIAELEKALRPFTHETNHHSRDCECRYCHARKVLDND